jgi:precorrin-2 dehydrogenase/sirohydrochlorin ferrochelatase
MHPVPPPASHLLPIVLDLADLPILLVGRSVQAVKRLAMLEAAGAAHVRVFSDRVAPDLLDVAEGRITQRLPTEAEIAAARLLLIGDLAPEEASPLVAAARRHRVLVNTEDQLANCDFHTPAIVRRGDLLLTVSTAGAAPALAARIKGWLEQQFRPHWGDRLTRAGTLRQRLRGRAATPREVIAAVNDLADDEAWEPIASPPRPDAAARSRALAEPCLIHAF